MIRLIDITYDDIRNGVQCDNSKCAIARALKREYKTDDISVYIPDDIITDVSTPVLLVNRKELNIRHENDVMDFIDCYDYIGDDYYPEPKPFTLEVVEQVST